MDNNAIPNLATNLQLSQPLDSQPAQNQTPVDIPSPKPESKKKNILLLVLLAVIIIIIATAFVILFIIQQSSKAVSSESVSNYCRQHNLAITEEPSGKVLFCKGSTNNYIIFRPNNGDVFSQNSIESSGFIELENTDSNKKFFAYTKDADIDVYYYIVCDNENCLLAAADSEKNARQTIIGIGYPDRNWASGEEQQTPIDAEARRRDIQRRNDMLRVDTSLVQYQTNYRGNLPTVSDIWFGAETFNCTGNSASACKFVQRYMNYGTDSSINTFKDPDGTFYNFSFQSAEGWGDGEIKDIAPADMNHTIYVVTSARCNGERAQKDAPRHFAILYRLEEGDIYCLDDQ